MHLLFFLLAILFFSSFGNAQDSLLIPRGDKLLSTISGRSENLSVKLDKKSANALSQLQKQEEKIRQKLSRLDSSKAKELLANAQEKYSALKNKIENPSGLTQYSP